MNDANDHRYDDIIGLPHRQSQRHPPMTMAERAAQFSPFAALTGYTDCIRETARTTEPRVELDEGEKEAIGERLYLLQAALAQQPRGQIPGIRIRWFVPDPSKDGGACVTQVCTVKKVDDAGQLIWLQDGTRIPIADVLAVGGDFFEEQEPETDLEARI